MSRYGNYKPNQYFYSEGYIYKGKETICKLFGSDKENFELGRKITFLLNNA